MHDQTQSHIEDEPDPIWGARAKRNRSRMYLPNMTPAKTAIASTKQRFLQ
jgi:hypothetical protein